MSSSPSRDSSTALGYETPARPVEGSALARHIGLFSLVVYGVGDMVGSGIYGTVGKAAGRMGNAVWLAFSVSMVAAMLTGLSYASLASRYPRAAGAAYVTQRAFRLSFLSYLVGLAVAASGLTSMATQSNVFGKAISQWVGFGPVLMWAFVLLAAMTAVNLWGIRESMWTNLVCTFVEVGGLLFVIVVGIRYWGSVNYLETPAATAVSSGLRPGMLLSGAVLTFFAFIGFEDMLNVGEEVKNPRRTMPWGIVLALLTATVLYISVAITSVSVVHYSKLKDAGAPLREITTVAAPWLPGWVYSFITLFAVANTMLINYIMGSRLLYGMAKQRLLPGWIGSVHRTRRTPHLAIFVLLAIVVTLILAGGREQPPPAPGKTAPPSPIDTLASATGLLLLTCFSIVNAALIVLKLRPGEPKRGFEVPIIIPALGIGINLTLIVARCIDADSNPRAPLMTGVILAAILVLYLIMRPKSLTEEQLAAAEGD